MAFGGGPHYVYMNGPNGNYLLFGMCDSFTVTVGPGQAERKRRLRRMPYRVFRTQRG